jgi:hypothetical protein
MKVPGLIVIAALLAVAFAPAQQQGIRPPERPGRPRPPLLVLPEKPGQDAGAACLHGLNETPADAERRLEAINAMRLIYEVLERLPVWNSGSRPVGFPDWQTLASSSAVAALKKATGRTGELANKIQWGTSEPLPGWRIQYSAGMSVVYALTDITDSCGFTLSSNDPRVVPQRARQRPLAPHAPN